MANTPDSSEMCDPCQIREKGAATICGWQGRSLTPHLKKHKKTKAKNSASWTLAEYKKRFPEHSVGAPTYVPNKEEVERFRSANPQQKTQQEPIVDVVDPIDSEAVIKARFEVLWQLCERDPAARVFCMSAARDEQILEDLYRRLKTAQDAKDFPELKSINQSLEMTSERLQNNYKSLSLTVEQRRKSNQLGSDTVSQLVGNWANTLRKMTTEQRENFFRRCASVRADIMERVRVKHLDDIILGDHEMRGDLTTDDDYRERISQFGKTN